MSFYDTVWWLSLALAGLSLWLMSLLVVRRIVHDGIERRRERRRQDLMGRLLDHLEGLDAVDPLPRSGRDAVLLAEVIEHLLRSVSGAGRQELIEVLRSLGGLDARLRTLRRGKEWERVAAASSLRFLDRAEVVTALHWALDDPSPNVRSAAARALFDLGAVGSAQLLIDKLVIEAAVPPQAVRDVFRKLGRAFRDELVAVLDCEVERARIVAIDALGHSGDLSAVTPLLGLLEDASKEIAANVYRALGLLGDPRALPMVKQGLRSPAWEVRCQAALCAGQIRAHEAGGLLTNLLDDPVWWVRYRAAEALFDLGEQGIEVLLRLSLEATNAGQTAQLVLAEKAVPS